MLKLNYKPVINHFLNRFSTSTTKNVKVVVVGASGGIGQPLGLLLKRSPLICKLNMYDVIKVPGVAKDLSHIDTRCKVEGYNGEGHLADALCDMEIVLLVAGIPRKPGQTRDDLFKENAKIVKLLGTACATYCPKAFVAVVSNPVNNMVPLIAEIYKKKGVFDEKKLFGVTSLDIVRAKTFISEIDKNTPPEQVKVDVIGGHSGETIIPVLSRSQPALKLDECELDKLIKRIQEAGTEVVKAKEGTGSATLSTAHATANFAFSLCRAIKGEPKIIECAYVKSCVTEAEYFATPILLGKEGVKENLGLGKLSEKEKEHVKIAVKALKGNIEEAKKFLEESECKEPKKK